jgi:hypothetical protein
VTLTGELVSLALAYLAMTLVGGYYLQKTIRGMETSVTAAPSVDMETLLNITIVKVFSANERLGRNFAKLMHDAMILGIKKIGHGGYPGSTFIFRCSFWKCLGILVGIRANCPVRG